MRSVNKVILMGNLTADPELRTTKSGKNVAHFSLATNNSWRDDEGNKKSSAEFHRVTTWQTVANNCSKYLKKGSPVYVEGRLRNRSYEGNDKRTHYITEVNAERVHFISTKKDQVLLQENSEVMAAAA